MSGPSMNANQWNQALLNTKRKAEHAEEEHAKKRRRITKKAHRIETSKSSEDATKKWSRAMADVLHQSEQFGK